MATWLHLIGRGTYGTVNQFASEVQRHGLLVQQATGKWAVYGKAGSELLRARMPPIHNTK